MSFTASIWSSTQCQCLESHSMLLYGEPSSAIFCVEPSSAIVWRLIRYKCLVTHPVPTFVESRNTIVWRGSRCKRFESCSLQTFRINLEYPPLPGASAIKVAGTGSHVIASEYFVFIDVAECVNSFWK